MAKSYFKCGELRKVLSHCNDEDEIVLDYRFYDIITAVLRAKEVNVKLKEQGIPELPLFPVLDIRINTASVSGTAYSSNSSADYCGTLFLELEIDKKEINKYWKEIDKAISELAKEGIQGV